MQTGTVCTSLLKSAVLCINSTLKKSQGTTPFRVMWGRDLRQAEMPNTKKQCQFIGPYTVTNSHAIVSNTQHSEKEKIISIDIVRPFYQWSCPL